MKRRILNLAVCATAIMSSMYAQGQPPNRLGLPNNPYGAAVNIPTLGTRTLVATACSTALSVGWSQNLCSPGYYPIAGAVVNMLTYTTCGSGYHGHDANCHTARPQAAISTPLQQVADGNGNAFYSVSLPGYAGYYTFEARFASMFGNSVAGLNYYGKDWDEWVADELGIPQVGPQSPFVNYLVDPNVNTPSIYSDFGHSNQIIYMDSEVSNAVENASLSYAQRSIQFLGFYDRMMIIRASLPDGGTNDDFSVLLSNGTSEWAGTTPLWTENASGDSVDIRNPAISSIGSGFPATGVNPAVPYLITLAMGKYKCYLGQFPISFTMQPSLQVGVGRNNYWNNQPIMHFVCGNAPFHEPTPVH
jgi:hypothetical protein